MCDREDTLRTRILICTIESWNSKVGANTYSELFSDYPSSQLANLYIREELPDSTCCSRYFQISEMKAIKSVLKKECKTGQEIRISDALIEEIQSNLRESKKIYNRNRKKRSYWKLCVRELLWCFSAWKSKELNHFLDDFKPDVVVFGMEGYIHFNRICRYIIQYTGAKSVGYFWDDNFTYQQMPTKLGYRFLRFFQRKSLRKLASQVDAFWAITEKTKQEADAFFGIDCQVLTKPIDFSRGDKWQPYQPHCPIKMLYTGNLLIGRFDVIKVISKALDRINQEQTRIELDVYSASNIPEEELKQLGQHVHMRGTVSQSEVLKLQTQADVLLFAEAYEGAMARKARLSFSTKLTDYFHSGKCIFAVGAKDVAPMEYLRAEDAAICASNEEEILEALLQMVKEPGIVSDYGRRAFHCGYRNHSRELIQEKRDATIKAILQIQ